MKKGVFLICFLLISCFFLSFVSAVTSLGVSICGNGVLEKGEQCDAGQIKYAGNANYLALGDLGCSLSTCTCPTGVSPEEYHFVLEEGSDKKCVHLTGCSVPDCSPGGKDFEWDLFHPHCGCEHEPACRCRASEPSYSICHSCKIPDLSGSPFAEHSFSYCYCGDSPEDLGASWFSDDTLSYCSDIGVACDYATCDITVPHTCYLGDSLLLPDCVAGSSSVSNSTTPSDAVTTTPSVKVGSSIKVGLGDDQKRDVICEATAIPNEKGTYTFTFSLIPSLPGISASPIISQEVKEVDICKILSPSPFTVTYTFKNVLTKSSKGYKCQVDFGTPSGSNFSISNALNDLDKDSFISKDQFSPSELKVWSRYDVDDWVFNDTLYGDSTKDYKCVNSGSSDYYSVILPEIANKKKNCTIDNNNDGIGDYASCSYCRNPNAKEDADDVDNNGFGVCQANVSRICRVEDYLGDGKDDASFSPIIESGVRTGEIGCGGIKNKFGILDNFCQMVDDVAGMKEYQRAVKWGEINYSTGSIDVSLADRTDHYIKKTAYSFIPGGVSNRNADCSFDIIIEPTSDTWTLLGKSAFTSLMTKYPGEYDDYTLEKKEFDGLGLNFIPILVKRIYYPLCLPENETNGRSKETSGVIFPEQFIDSFRGELNFDSFALSPVLKEKDAGKFLWKWKTAFVSKDKCNDGADNNGPKNLFEAAPYGFYLPRIASFRDERTSVDYAVPSIFNVPLVDVDDPSCNFNIPLNVSLSAAPKVYSLTEHKTNPVTGITYCKDDDGDGFCGAKQIFVDDLTSCEKPILGGGCAVYSKKLIPNLNDTNYSIPKQFPDCDDKLDDDWSYSLVDGSRLLTSPSLGWGENLTDELAGKDFSAWNVHPFAPVNKFTCTLEKWDFNCNKNGIEGINPNLLLNGDTPFDWDLSTGKEQLAYGQDTKWYNLIGLAGSYESNRDMLCYEYPPYKDFAKETSAMVAMSAVSFIPGLSFIYGLKAIQVGFTLGDIATIGDCFYANKVDKACIAAKAASATVSALTFGAAHVQAHPPASTSSRAYKLVYQATTKQFSLQSSVPTARSLAAPESVKEVTAPKPGCFLANTSVILENGSFLNIQDLKIGDRIMAYDLENNKPVNASVTYTFVRNETKYRLVEYEAID